MVKKLFCCLGLHELEELKELETAEPLSPNFFYCKHCGAVYEKGIIDIIGEKIGFVKINANGNAIADTFIKLNKRKSA